MARRISNDDPLSLSLWTLEEAHANLSNAFQEMLVYAYCLPSLVTQGVHTFEKRAHVRLIVYGPLHILVFPFLHIRRNRTTSPTT